MTTSAIPETPVQWKKLIKYQEGSIVSRELVKTQTGTITLFAFDAGQGLSSHQTPFEALVQVLDGSGMFTIDGVEHEVKKGEMIVMPSHHPHSVRAVEKFIMLLTMIKSN